MADLGSFSALSTDIDVKVTTNGAQENTGLRVRTNLHNMADTVEGRINAGDDAVTTAFTTALESYAPINALGILYLFDTATTASDPGSATLRYNNATFGSITEIYFNKVSQNGLDLSSFYDQQGPGLLTLKEVQGAQLSTFRVTAITDSGDYYTLAVIPLVGSIYSAGLQIVLEFDRNDGGMAPSSVLTYIAVISQSGTSAPVALATLVDTLTTHPDFSDMEFIYGSTGQFKFGDPSEIQTFPLNGFGADIARPSDNNKDTGTDCSDNLAVLITSSEAGSPANDVLLNSLFTLYVQAP